MKTIGIFTEMGIYADDGSVKEYLVDEIDYDREKMIRYLNAGETFSICAKPALDCVTGKPIRKSFQVKTDGEYEWVDFLADHIERYNIKLPEEFVKKAMK